MGFASISTDLYLPAMPVMEHDLDANSGDMELTISGFLIGFSVGQLIFGPISDRFGRRGPIAFGLVLFIIGSAGCALANSAEQIIVWRIIQAFGACAGVVLSRAMVRDLYQGAEAARTLSTLLTIMAIAPLLGPLVGVQILAFAGWRAIFWALVLIGTFTLVALMTVPETLPPTKRRSQSVLVAFASYRALLSDRRLMALAGTLGFFYVGIYAYVAGTPFAYIGFYKIDGQYYGILFALGVVGIMATNMINLRLVKRIDGTKILLVGAAGAAVTGAVTATLGLTGWGGLWALAAALFVFVSWSGLIVANAMSEAMQNFPQQSGTVSALMGAFQYGFGIIGSAAVSFLADGTILPLGIVIFTAGSGCLICAILGVEHEQRKIVR